MGRRIVESGSVTRFHDMLGRIDPGVRSVGCNRLVGNRVRNAVVGGDWKQRRFLASPCGGGVHPVAA